MANFSHWINCGKASMPHKPAIEVTFTPEFKRNLRGLAKKYPHIRSDVQPIIEQIQRGKFVGDKVQGTGT